MKYHTINGWTKEKMKAQIRKYNNGTLAREGFSCAYKNEVGNRCAIGCFIPDAFFEGPINIYDLSVVGLLNRYPFLYTYMPFEENKVLTEFQNIHDKAIQTHEELFKWIDENVIG